VRSMKRDLIKQGRISKLGFGRGGVDQPERQKTNKNFGPCVGETPLKKDGKGEKSKYSVGERRLTLAFKV